MIARLVLLHNVYQAERLTLEYQAGYLVEYPYVSEYLGKYGLYTERCSAPTMRVTGYLGNGDGAFDDIVERQLPAEIDITKELASPRPEEM